MNRTVPDVFVTKASVTQMGESESFIYITDGEPRLVFLNDSK